MHLPFNGPHIYDYPKELSSSEHSREDVSILIGENGSGKSTLLNALANHHINRGKTVIAITNSIHDKFNVSHRRFHALKGRAGRRMTRATIKESFSEATGNNVQRLRNASLALAYVGFSPLIGFQILNLKRNYRDIIRDSGFFSDTEKEMVTFLLGKASSEFQKGSIIWLGMSEYSFNEIDRSSLVELFAWESRLVKLKVLSRIEIFLQRDNQIIPLLSASSGELALIISIVYVSTLIDRQTVLLIDEPENSLHPKWQKEYIRMFLDLFSLYQPKIIVATHSPLIVNGTELFVDNPKIYRAENFHFELLGHDPLNVEELLFKFFNVTTPQNRFVSAEVVKFLNLLIEEKISKENFTKQIDKLITGSYDAKQQEVLASVIQLSSKIKPDNDAINN